MPWRYRHVTSHLPLEDGLLSRRLQSMLAVQLENQRLLGQAVNSTLQHNPQIQQHAQFVSPGMMQMSQFGYPNSMLPPQQQLNRTPSSYHHNPYPQQQRPATHQRSASIASPQDLASIQTHQQPPKHLSADGRRMSSPANNLHAQTHPHPNALSNRSTSYQSNHASAPNTPAQHATSASPEQKTQQQSGLSVSNNHFGASQQQEMDSPFAPLTTSLPMDTQQLLAGAQGFPTFDLFGSQEPMKPQHQQPFYSYKPNTGSGSMKAYQPSSTAGLDQTLLGTALDTNLSNKADSAFTDTPISTDSTSLYSAMSDSGYGYGFDGSMFNFDAYNNTGSGLNTPGNLSNYNEPMFNDFLESEMFGDGQAGPAS